MDMDSLYQLAVKRPRVAELIKQCEELIEVFESYYKKINKERFFGNDSQVAIDAVMAHTLEIFNLNTQPKSQKRRKIIDQLRASFMLAIKNIYGREINIHINVFEGIMQLDAYSKSHEMDDKDLKQRLISIESKFFKAILKSGHVIPSFRTLREKLNIEILSRKTAARRFHFQDRPVDLATSKALHKKIGLLKKRYGFDALLDMAQDHREFSSTLAVQIAAAIHEMTEDCFKQHKAMWANGQETQAFTIRFMRKFERSLKVANHLQVLLKEAQSLAGPYPDIKAAMQAYCNDRIAAAKAGQEEPGTHRNFQRECEEIVYKAELALHQEQSVAFKKQSRALKIQLCKMDEIIFTLFEKQSDLLKQGYPVRARKFVKCLAELKQVKRKYLRDQLSAIAENGEQNSALAKTFTEQIRRLIDTARDQLQRHADILPALSALALASTAVGLTERSHIEQSDSLQEQLNRVSRASGVLTIKANSLESKASAKSKAAREVVDKLDQNMQCYFGSQVDNIKRVGHQNADFTYNFKLGCTELMDQAKSELGMHRNTLPLLANIVLAVASVGILPAINYYATGSWAFFETDSAVKLRQVKQSLQVNIR